MLGSYSAQCWHWPEKIIADRETKDLASGADIEQSEALDGQWEDWILTLNSESDAGCVRLTNSIVSRAGVHAWD